MPSSPRSRSRSTTLQSSSVEPASTANAPLIVLCPARNAFSADSDYFAPSTAPFMVNFVVDDLDGVLAKARSEGVEPVGEPMTEVYGKFGWLMDPAGVKIELWEPAKDGS